MRIQFPILLTMAQPDVSEDEDQICQRPRDVLRSIYHQGDCVDDDWIESDWQEVAASSRKDEYISGSPSTSESNFLISVDGRKRVDTGQPVEGDLGDDPRLLASGQQILCLDQQDPEHCRLQKVDLATGMRNTLYDSGRRKIIDFDPDREGKIWMALSNPAKSREGNQLMTIARDATVTEVAHNDNWHMEEFIVAPDGNSFAFVNNEDGHVYLQETGGRLSHRLSIAEIEEPNADPLEVGALRRGHIHFTPDGSRVLYATTCPHDEELDGALFAAPIEGGSLKYLLGGCNTQDYIHDACPAGPPSPLSLPGSRGEFHPAA